MEDEKELSGQESLALIHRMIAQAQNKFHDDGFFYLLWGWLVFVASTSCYVITEYVDPKMAGWPWAILMPAGGVTSAIAGWRYGKKRAVKTYTEAVLDYVLVSFLVCLSIVLVLVSASKDGWQIAYPLVMMIYGMWLFVTGGIMRFRPLIIGGVLNWALSISGFFVHSTLVILMVSVAVLVGYIIPGYMLKAAYRKENEVI